MRIKGMKKLLAVILAAALAMGMGVTAFADDSDTIQGEVGSSDSSDEVTVDEGDKPFVSLGADLREDERATVLELLGLTEDDLTNCDVITVTNEQEHEYLDSYISSDKIGNRALSSVVVMQGEKGSGIKVTTKNINYCTAGMYENALSTAGVEDAEVIVAGPFEISGTAALIGAIEAYSVMSGKDVTTDVIDGAVDEIVTTGDLESSTGEESDTIEGMVQYLKEQVGNSSDMSDEELQQTIEDAAEKFNVTLTQEQIDQLMELLKKLQGLDINWDSVQQQASNLYQKLKDNGFDISSIDTEQVAKQASGFFAKLIEFIKSLFNK